MRSVNLKSSLLLGTASILQIWPITLQAQEVAQNGQVMAQNANPLPEQVLVTGSLIHGTTAVGVPVTNLSAQDYIETGSLTTSELFRDVPQALVSPGESSTTGGGKQERGTRVNLRGVDRGAVHELLMVDGARIPPQGDGLCIIDPSIIPALAVDRVDILADGASATYGSDAVTGVINIILKRGYDGAVTQLRGGESSSGNWTYQASQLWGRTWDGGDVTLTYEWSYQTPIYGTAHSQYTENYSPWGLDDRRPISGSMPGTISIGKPASNTGTNCGNCYAIPAGSGQNFPSNINSGLGPLVPGQVPVLNWSTLTSGTTNLQTTYANGWETDQQQRNGAVITVDQRLFPGVSAFGSAFYSNRRLYLVNAGDLGVGTNVLAGVSIPTSNPYYPTGAPSSLRVSYDTTYESRNMFSAYELARRYQGGLNIDLPEEWHGQIYYAKTVDDNVNNIFGVNPNAVSAALGWTMPATAAAGTSPGIATYTKPATIPYLNLFCDPTRFQCNSQQTLDYIHGMRRQFETYGVGETQATFDGPLFNLPAGQVKVAVGGTYDSIHYNFNSFSNTASPSLLAATLNDPRQRTVWAGFAQLNIPVFGGAVSLPGIRKLDLEASWRHDQYSDVGGTSNPKVAVNWLFSEDLGLQFKGSWGTSFRAPNFAETAGEGSINIPGYNLPANLLNGGSANNAPIPIICNGGAPTAGSAAADLVTAGFACGTTEGGVSISGGSQAVARLRITGLNSGPNLKPEVATNWSAGVMIAPTTFLRGLAVEATWYSIKITGVLDALGNPSSTNFNSPINRGTYILPSNLGCPAAQNATPTQCIPFEQMVGSVINDPNSTVAPGALSQIYWIEDNGLANLGWRKLQGIDWNASYDLDLGDYGAWNTGITGTYYLHDSEVTGLGVPPVDYYHQTLASVGGIQQNGVETLPRMHYRSRLGWSDGRFSVTGFVNYDSHFFAPQNAPPNVNFQCVAAGGTVGGGTYPCAINNYTNVVPSYYTFDLSLGYSTGDTPANAYLKNVGVQLVIQDITDKHPPFEYRVSTRAGIPAAFDILKGDQGRIVSLILTKTW